MQNLLAGWIGMGAGVLSGAVIGLFFHREKWLGGYGSFERRMLRLGHISFFGIGLLNIQFGLTVLDSHQGSLIVAGSWALVLTNLLMPMNCFLTAWRKQFRHLFFIPVVGASWGVVAAIAYILNTG